MEGMVGGAEEEQGGWGEKVAKRYRGRVLLLATLSFLPTPQADKLRPTWRWCRKRSSSGPPPPVACAVVKSALMPCLRWRAS